MSDYKSHTPATHLPSLVEDNIFFCDREVIIAGGRSEDTLAYHFGRLLGQFKNTYPMQLGGQNFDSPEALLTDGLDLPYTAYFKELSGICGGENEFKTVFAPLTQIARSQIDYASLRNGLNGFYADWAKGGLCWGDLKALACFFQQPEFLIPLGYQLKEIIALTPALALTASPEAVAVVTKRPYHKKSLDSAKTVVLVSDEFDAALAARTKAIAIKFGRSFNENTPSRRNCIIFLGQLVENNPDFNQVDYFIRNTKSAYFKKIDPKKLAVFLTFLETAALKPKIYPVPKKKIPTARRPRDWRKRSFTISRTVMPEATPVLVVPPPRASHILANQAVTAALEQARDCLQGEPIYVVYDPATSAVDCEPNRLLPRVADLPKGSSKAVADALLALNAAADAGLVGHLVVVLSKAEATLAT